MEIDTASFSMTTNQSIVVSTVLHGTQDVVSSIRRDALDLHDPCSIHNMSSFYMEFHAEFVLDTGQGGWTFVMP